MSKWTAMIAAALIIIAAPFARAQVSLWSGGTAGESANIMRPAKARDFQVHDIVHIIVVVAAESTTEEEVGLKKSSDSNKSSIADFIALNGEANVVSSLTGHELDDLRLDMSSQKAFEGAGTAEREDTLRTRLAAEIIEIKPNGNIVVEARSRVAKSRETTIITLTGVVRPQDVAPDNIIYSHNIADIDINYESSGPVSDANERGWLLKLLDSVWPF